MKETQWQREWESSPAPIYTECATEYTLPDYLPEVRRVLSVQGKVMPEGRYVAGGQAECSGSCLFSLFYTDPVGDLASLSVPLEYQYVSSTEVGEGEEAQFFETVCLEQISCRLVGPRKLQLRGMVVSRPKWWVSKPEQDFPEGEGNLEFLQKETPSKITFPFFGEEKSISAALPLSGGVGMQLLSSDGCVFVRELAENQSGINAKGEVKLEAVLVGEDGMPFSVSAKVPFEESLPKESSIHSFCVGEISSLESNLKEDEQGCQVVFEGTMRLLGYSTEEKERMIFTDAFSTEYPTEVKYGEEKVWRKVENIAKYFTLDGSIDRQGELLSAPINIAHTSLRWDSPTVSTEGNILTAQTNAHVTMLLVSEEGEEGVSTHSFHFDYPVKMELTLTETPPKDSKWEGIITAAPAQGRLDQNKLFFECEVCLSLFGTVEETYYTVEQVTTDKSRPYPKEQHQILAVYLEDGDSLWSIAKRYHTSPESIAKQNALAEEALDAPDQAYTLDGYIRLLIST